MDRRRDRSDGSGGASPTVVSSRSNGDDLIGVDDDQDSRPSDVVAPPRRPTSTPSAAKSAPGRAAPPDDAVSEGTAGGGLSANGAPASGNGIEGTRDASANGGKDASANGSAAATAKDTASAAALDDTIADGVPALPADTVGSSHGTQPAPPGWTVADPESAAKPSWDDASPTAPSATGPSGLGPSGSAPSGRPSSSVPSVSAEPASLSPAAFAWEMSDPPPDSRSSPARTFLRSGSATKDPAVAPAAAAAATAAAVAAPKADSSASTGQATAAKTATGEGPVTMRSGGRKAQSKRSVRRQAHLTVARVEPWSVMKFSFVISLVAFVILFVAVSILYAALQGLGVFDSLQRVVTSLTSSQGSAGVNAKVWFTASKVLGYTALLGSLNIVLITAMSTIGAVVYNLTSRLVGGVEVTLRETE